MNVWKVSSSNILGSTWTSTNKGVFLSLGAALPPRAVSRVPCPWRRRRAAAGVSRPRIDIASSRSRPTRPPRRPFAYLDASGSCVHNPPPTTPADTPPQITAYKANFIGTCMQYAQGAGPNCSSDRRPDRLLWYSTPYIGYCMPNLKAACSWNSFCSTRYIRRLAITLITQADSEQGARIISNVVGPNEIVANFIDKCYLNNDLQTKLFFSLLVFLLINLSYLDQFYIDFEADKIVTISFHWYNVTSKLQIRASFNWSLERVVNRPSAATTNCSRPLSSNVKEGKFTFAYWLARHQLRLKLCWVQMYGRGFDPFKT